MYKIHQDLEEIKKKVGNKLKNVQLIPLLSSIQDEDRMRHVIKTYMPNTLYHAAAYKHVPLVEENICEGVRNNVLGTLNIAKIAIEQKFLISYSFQVIKLCIPQMLWVRVSV